MNPGSSAGGQQSGEPVGRRPLVAPDFVAPAELVTPHTVLRPLGPGHNRSDLHAWTSSIAHIRSTPGFGSDSSWPPDAGMSSAANMADLEAHRRDFEDGVGFTFTVLDRAMIGALPVAGRPEDIAGPATGRETESKTGRAGSRGTEPANGQEVGDEIVVGCVYIYPDRSGEHDVEVRSWVVASRPELDREVWSAVSSWLQTSWPFASVRYAPRPA